MAILVVSEAAGRICDWVKADEEALSMLKDVMDQADTYEATFVTNRGGSRSDVANKMRWIATLNRSDLDDPDTQKKLKAALVSIYLDSQLWFLDRYATGREALNAMCNSVMAICMLSMILKRSDIPGICYPVSLFGSSGVISVRPESADKESMLLTASLDRSEKKKPSTLTSSYLTDILEYPITLFVGGAGNRNQIIQMTLGDLKTNVAFQVNSFRGGQVY